MENLSPLPQPMDFDEQFLTLLEAWNNHQRLRSSGAPVSDLFASRATLDASRLNTAKLSLAR